MFFRAIVSSLAAMLVLIGCAAPQPKVQSNFDRNVDFSAFRTYEIMETAGQRQDGGYDTLAGQYIRNAIHREMLSRGYVRAAQPDLWVNFSLTVQSVQEVTQVPSAAPPAYGYRGRYYRPWPAYTYDTWVREYDEGTLLIDLVAAERMQLVWEAAGTGRLSQPLTENLEARADNAVNLLFQRYPFRAGP
jgi:hypothetical protein